MVERRVSSMSKIQASIPSHFFFSQQVFPRYRMASSTALSTSSSYWDDVIYFWTNQTHSCGTTVKSLMLWSSTLTLQLSQYPFRFDTFNDPMPFWLVVGLPPLSWFRMFQSRAETIAVKKHARVSESSKDLAMSMMTWSSWPVKKIYLFWRSVCNTVMSIYNR